MKFENFFKNVLECILTDDTPQEYFMRIPDEDIREFLICVHAYNERELSTHPMCLGIGDTDAETGLTNVKVFVD